MPLVAFNFKTYKKDQKVPKIQTKRNRPETTSSDAVSDLSIDLLLWKILLFSQTKFLDQSTVSLDIYFLEVCKKSSSLSNHLKKSSS